jgi:L-threonylcarbamoyladenylate synthase
MSTDQADQIDQALRAVSRGAVIGIPTDTVYGIGADANLPGAARRIFEAKGRPESVALPVLIAEPEEARSLAELDERALLLIGRHWPGPLTLVLPRARGVHLDLGGDPSTVGLRCPDHATARAILRRTGPLAVTSANRHGEPPAHTAEEVRALLGPSIEVVVDGGPCEGASSTVISLVTSEPAVLRVGALSVEALLQELSVDHDPGTHPAPTPGAPRAPRAGR